MPDVATPLRTPAPSGVTDGHTVFAIAVVPARPDRVYRALTEPAHIERWRGSADAGRWEWHAELRVGGGIRAATHFADGQVVRSTGEYLELEPCARIVHTRRYDWDFPQLARRTTLVTYMLEAADGGTRICVRHDGFDGFHEAAARHLDEWKRALAGLRADLLAGA